MPERPDLVLSGINRGSNLGTDVFYSGTVAAAMEASFNGLPAIAVSLHIEPEDRANQWETAARVAVRVAEGVAASPLPEGVFLNVNVPNVPFEALRGIKVTSLGQRRYAPLVEPRTDPRGRRYYWIGGAHEEFAPIAGSDGQVYVGMVTTIGGAAPFEHYRSARVLRVNPAAALLDVVADLGTGAIGSLAPAAGGLYVAVDGGVRAIDTATGAVTPVCTSPLDLLSSMTPIGDRHGVEQARRRAGKEPMRLRRLVGVDPGPDVRDELVDPMHR